MVYNSLNKRLLDVSGIFNNDFLTPSFCVQRNGVIGEYGETNHAFVSNDFYTVFAGGFVGDKAPGAAAHQSAVKLETCA